MKITTASLRRAVALCAAGTFLLTPVSYARHPHTKIHLAGEDRERKESSKDKESKKEDSKQADSPDEGGDR